MTALQIKLRQASIADWPRVADASACCDPWAAPDLQILPRLRLLGPGHSDVRLHPTHQTQTPLQERIRLHGQEHVGLAGHVARHDGKRRGGDYV